MQPTLKMDGWKKLMILYKAIKRPDKKISKGLSEGSHGMRITGGRTKDSLSNVSCLDDHHDERLTVKFENTYRLEPQTRFPAPALQQILKDVLKSYLEEEQYEVEWSRQMTKTICEVVRARVKELMIRRYKVVVMVHIGQLAGQSMEVSSRCLWDPSSDTFASWSLKNTSLYGVASVYAVYHE
ncbi:dynein light chain Tctex-type 5 isoform X1 [Syngnathus typhle]|uniref:dynein light chain Tctex-type 5 isoform X1 n=2 Tax=Syngnathus typhle TaxID=161592 RepID=UPI002A6A69D3|nr:dynein light chain Tctex-type 5 isoform X1 [Syngnathus typhle]